MARKNNLNNPLQIRLKTVSLPKNVSRREYYQRLLEYVQNGQPLPSSWNVELEWRNPRTHIGKTKQWRSDTFEDAISDSRDGFVKAVTLALMHGLRRMKK